VKFASFDPRVGAPGMSTVRPLRFEERSLLPLSAACIVANAMREILAPLLGKDVHLLVYEPLVPSRRAWREIEKDASLYALTGTLADAAIIVRVADARALVAAIFQESAADERPISAIERTVLDRAIWSLRGALCALVGSAPQRDASSAVDISTFATYFELQIVRPLDARIGIAVSREPAAAPGAGLAARELLDLEVELAVRLRPIRMPADFLVGLEPGAFVPMTESPRMLHASVELAGRPVASGECGVVGGRYAIAIDRSIIEEGSVVGA
jgi:hypothetical protein